MKELHTVVAGVAFGMTLFGAIACVQAQNTAGQITELHAHSGNAAAGDTQLCMVFQIGGSDTIGPGTGRYAIDRADPGYTDEKDLLEMAFAGAAGNQIQLQFHDSGVLDANCANIEYVTSVVLIRVLR
jgi:hypothetical protein